MRSLYFTERILSHIHIPIRRIVQHLTGSREPGAVASTVPAMLLPVVFQRTAQVGTSLCCGDQEIRSCFGAIEEQLGLPRSEPDAPGASYPAARPISPIPPKVLQIRRSHIEIIHHIVDRQIVSCVGSSVPDFAVLTGNQWGSRIVSVSGFTADLWHRWNLVFLSIELWSLHALLCHKITSWVVWLL